MHFLNGVTTLVCALIAPLASAVTIDWVSVGNAANAADAPLSNCYAPNCGSVEYDYSISKYEVTNSQYAELLNAKAASDPFGLYHTSMGSDATFGGITRYGASGGYTYAVKAGFENKPVTYVTFYDGLRFANWMTNGQGMGSTERGAYTLFGAMETPTNGPSVTRSSGNGIFVPSENEWYKAAYYGADGAYFDFPMGSDVPPDCVAPGADTGNSANCDSTLGALTDVGSYGLSSSPFGTFDQGGNVFEWNEEIRDYSFRAARGGAWRTPTLSLAASSPGPSPGSGRYDLGLRVVRIGLTLPEPSVCGDGIVQVAIECDDANFTSGDGCSEICEPEAGFTCTGQPSVCAPKEAAAIYFDWVPIGNAGNFADAPSANCFARNCGAVAYEYFISPREVTNTQYAEFLNAKAAADPLNLYSSSMETDATFGGIIRSGAPGSHIYTTKDGFENKPVTYVSFYDAVRFANWMNNGKGIGDTESGAYTLLGGTPTPSNASAVTRNGGAKIFLPSENEWYKAAYYDPLTATYFDYPTGTNTEIGCAAPALDTGNSANCRPHAYPPGAFTDVGAYSRSGSPHGTFDQGGNVTEWNEQYVSASTPLYDFLRGVRGGAFGSAASELSATDPSGGIPANDSFAYGFRLASHFPECGDGFDNDDDGLADFPTDPGCESPDDLGERFPGCSDGADNDGDAVVDFPDDPGCDSAGDLSEHSSLLPCDDGNDNDGDGLVDFQEDPVCQAPAFVREDARCQDGVNNDGAITAGGSDLLIDFDGGASLNGGVPLTGADPDCMGQPHRNSEYGACGLGAELALVMLVLGVAGSRRQRMSGR